MTGELKVEQRELKEDIVNVTEELFAVDIITATGGNISARIPGTDIVWITPTKLFKGGLCVDDLIRIDLEGNMLEGKTKPSIEAPLHSAVYRAREDVFAVVHSHAPFATAIGLCERPFPPITLGGFFVSKLPIVPYAASGKDLAKAVMERIADWPGVFLQNHGLVAIGKDLRSAANLTQMVEHLGKVLMIYRTLGDGEPKTLPQTVLDFFEKMAPQLIKMVL